MQNLSILRSTTQIDMFEETNENKYLTLIPTDKTEDWKNWKSMTNHGAKLNILLYQQIIIQMVMMENIWNQI